MADSIEKIRDYKHERELRNKRNIRFVFELNITKGEKFKQYLKKNNITLSQWIKDQINEIEGKNNE